MPTKSQKSALLIAGPTASGKSALALDLARTRNGVIINADSMQVYRDLRILSARPSAEEESLAPHRLYGHVGGADEYSVGRWLVEADQELTRCWQQGMLPIVVGGTGLYFRALLQGLAELPPIPADIRQKWRSFGGDLHAELARRDGEGAARLHPSDAQRLIRALEVVEATGHPLSHWQREAASRAPLHGVETERLFMEMPRADLYARAEQRFDHMMAAGALDEVRALRGLQSDRPVMKAIGVPELMAHLQGLATLEDAVRDAKTATRNYIKRQLTWWRGQMQDWTVVPAAKP